MIFFSLIFTAISSIFYGTIATAVVIVLLYAILRAVNKGMVQTPAFFITCFVLALLLVIQFSLFIGAIQAKDAVDSSEIYLTQLLENTNGIVTAQDCQYLMDAITEEFPIIGSYISLANFSGYETSELPEVMHNSMLNFLDSYIWHRILWIFGFILIACFIIAFFEKKGLSSRKSARRRIPSQAAYKHRRYKY